MDQKKVQKLHIWILTIYLDVLCHNNILKGRYEYVEDISILKSGFNINYDETGNSAYTLPFDANYPDYLQALYRDLLFLKRSNYCSNQISAHF